MELSVRKPPYLIPSYSLTGDLLSFLRCGLQYRYGGLGQLPATRPAQMWFGQFIHGVLEEAFRRYRQHRDEHGIGRIVTGAELDEIFELIIRRLAASGLRARNADLESVGRARALAAVAQLGPQLFPIINEAEIPLNGTRHVPFDRWPASLPRRESDRYEMAGIVDVITEIQVDDPDLADNAVVRTILDALPGPLPGHFEVIVDYKGMRRPSITAAPNTPDYWKIYDWQLQTYARLRAVQPTARPVVAAALVFLNELHQTRSDTAALQHEAAMGLTDVVPAPGSPDALALRTWRPGNDSLMLSPEFRLARALRVVPVNPSSQAAAATEFDDVVFDIEVARAKERQSPHILTEWPTNASDDATCTACDWRTICPEHPSQEPTLPGREKASATTPRRRRRAKPEQP